MHVRSSLGKRPERADEGGVVERLDEDLRHRIGASEAKRQVGVRRDEQDRHRRAVGPREARYGDAVDLRHPQVRHQHVGGRCIGQALQPREAAGADLDGEPVAPQEIGEFASGALVVVDDEHPKWRSGAGGGHVEQRQQAPRQANLACCCQVCVYGSDEYACRCRGCTWANHRSNPGPRSPAIKLA
jgi:hypothetical protein